MGVPEQFVFWLSDLEVLREVITSHINKNITTLSLKGRGGERTSSLPLSQLWGVLIEGYRDVNCVTSVCDFYYQVI